MSQYSFSEADAGIPGRKRLEMLAAASDTGTIEHLVGLGVSEGWRCAEIGAGAGTIARWLRDQVGASGQTLATDLDTQWLGDLAESGVEVRVQDIAADAPGDSYFDLVHARALLTHVPDLHLAIEHMVTALRPGGWVLLEEYDQGQPFGRTSPEEPLVARFVEAEVELVKKAGGDPYLGGRLPSVIREHGLTDTGVHARYFHLTPQIVQIQLDGVGDTLVSQGAMQRAELDQVRDFVSDQTNLMYGPMLVAAWGRKPA